ncbi:TPA: hypothetical protein ACQXS9_001810, partial [Streptococcus pneumoniae]
VTMKKQALAIILILFTLSPFSINALEYNSNTSFKSVNNTIQNTRDLEILQDELERYISENPNAVDKDKDEHLKSFIIEGGLNKTNRESRSYLSGYNNLNSEEKKLARNSPYQAIQVNNAAKTATNKTIEIYGKNGYQDNSDAFRHCLWNALMKQSIGATAAEKWATAHEYNSYGIDKQMDLHNNYIGRSIYVSGKSLNAITSEVKSKVRNGSCKRIIRNKLVPTNGYGL